jgi:hypothetical protein
LFGIYGNIPTVMYIITISMLHSFFVAFARVLTDMEAHLVEREYNNSLLFKASIFSLLNLFAYPLYLAIGLGDLGGLIAYLWTSLTIKQLMLDPLTENVIPHLKELWAQRQATKHGKKADKKFIITKTVTLSALPEASGDRAAAPQDDDDHRRPSSAHDRRKSGKSVRSRVHTHTHANKNNKK